MTTSVPLLTAAGRWSADVTETSVGLVARGLFGHRVHGSFPLVSARVDLHDDGKVEVSALLDASALDTGNARRDKDLRGPRFFDVVDHPRLAFRSAGSRLTSTGWLLDGRLTIRGQECPLEVSVVVDQLTDDVARVSAEGIIDLHDTPIRAPAFVIGRQVTFSVTSVWHRERL